MSNPAPVYFHLDPAQFLTMERTVEVLYPYLDDLMTLAGPRLSSGSGKHRLVISPDPALGPAARLYAGERADRDCADDLIVVYQPGTGRLEGLFIGAEIGRWRVGALSAIALKRLMPKRVAKVALFGCGGQARAQAHALTVSARPDLVMVVGRDAKKTQGFCESLAEETKLSLLPASNARSALVGAEVVITATSSESPLFEADECEPNATIIHIGSKTATGSEISAAIYAGADLIVTDAPAELAALEQNTVLHAAGRLSADVVPLTASFDPLRLTGRKIYLSLGLCGAESVIARQLCEVLRQRPR